MTPAQREADLAAIAAGRTRTPTAAHPDCRCGRPYLPTCRSCYAKPNKPCRRVPYVDDDFDPDPDGPSLEARHGRCANLGQPRDCPQHRPEPRRSTWTRG